MSPLLTGKPTYLVEVKASDLFRVDRDGYHKAAGKIDVEHITRAYECYPEDGFVKVRPAAGYRL